MFLLFCLFLSVLIGLFRKGRLSNLALLHLRRIELPLCAFLLEAFSAVIVQHLSLFGGYTLWVLALVEYSLLFVFIWINREIHGIYLAGVGLLLNFLVIMANGGAMPLSRGIADIPSQARKLEMLLNGNIPEYALIGPDTHMWFLGDVIYIPFPDASFASAGDILLALGLFFLIQKVMIQNRKEHEEVQL